MHQILLTARAFTSPAEATTTQTDEGLRGGALYPARPSTTQPTAPLLPTACSMSSYYEL